MGVLYIIGNGFDVSHGLKTQTNDFLENLRAIHVFGADSALDQFEYYGVNWGDYEMSLGDMDLQVIEEQILEGPDYLSDYESDRDGVIFNTQNHLEGLTSAVECALVRMVDKANADLAGITPHLNLEFYSDDAILSFNYTSTLEALYESSRNCETLHIHGFREKGDDFRFGHGRSIEQNEYYQRCFTDSEFDGWGHDRDYYIDKQREEITSFYARWKKSLALDELHAFLHRHIAAKIVIVLGHSMSSVDERYFEMIETTLKPAQWLVSQYKGSPSVGVLHNYSFSGRVSFFEFDRLADNRAIWEGTQSSNPVVLNAMNLES